MSPTVARMDRQEVGGSPEETAAATVLLIDVEAPAEERAAPAADPLDTSTAESARRALAAAPAAVDGAVRQATEGALAPVLGQAGGRAPDTSAPEPLHMWIGWSDADTPPFALDVSVEQIEPLVVHCYLVGGWPEVGRLATWLSRAAEARDRGVVESRPPPPDALIAGGAAGPLGVPPATSPELKALGETAQRLNTAIADEVVRLAERTARRLQARTAAVRAVVERERTDYAIAAVAAAKEPQPGGTQGGSGSGSAAGGSGGAAGSDGTKAQPTKHYSAPDGKEGDRARALVALVQEIGPLRAAYDGARENLRDAERAREAEQKRGSAPPAGGGAGGGGGADGEGGRSGRDEPVDAARIASLRDVVAHLRGPWQTRLLEASRPVEPAPAGRNGAAAVPQQRPHPLLPGIVAVCVAAPPDGARYSSENVLGQASRYLETALAALQRATYAGAYPVAALRAAMAAGDAPEQRAARWALDEGKPYAVEPLASDAILSELKSSALEALSHAATDADAMQAMFAYRVLVSFWEELIVERERRATEAVHRNDWWVRPTSKLASAFSLASWLYKPLWLISAGIALGQLLILMDDVEAEVRAAGAKEEVEATLASEDDRLAMAIAGRPSTWRMFAALGPQMAAEVWLSLALPRIAIAYDVANDLLSLADQPSAVELAGKFLEDG